MKYFYFLALSIFLFSSCKPYKSTVEKPNQKTYSQFRDEQNIFSSTDGNIHYIDKGKGDVIVMLHGVPTSGWLYRNMIDELVDNGYRVIVPDMLGYGASDSPKGFEIYSEEKHADRFLNLMDSLKIEHWSQVIHDVGGLWTWELIKKQPDRITNLIILNTIIYESGFNPPIRFKPGFFARTAMWSYRNGISTNAMLNKLFKSGLIENNLNKIDVEGYKVPLLEGKTRGMYYFFSNTCNYLPDYSNIIKNLDIPKLLIWGKQDEFLVFDKMKKDIVKDLNLSEENIHLIDAKHFIQEEKPEEINTLILNFLKH
jgi:pimeloyl-ACP methyl ester carboxylesterase